VFESVKAYAEPLVDNFNSAPSRLLPLSDFQGAGNRLLEKEARPEGSGEFPEMPCQIRQASKQILEVVRLMGGVPTLEEQPPDL